MPVEEHGMSCQIWSIPSKRIFVEAEHHGGSEVKL